jgi:hypothetical protein
MTPEHEQNLKEANESFMALNEKKYRAGQAEHGGNLWEVPNLIDEAMNEIVDLWNYLFNLKKQIRHLQAKFDAYKDELVDKSVDK